MRAFATTLPRRTDLIEQLHRGCTTLASATTQPHTDYTTLADRVLWVRAFATSVPRTDLIELLHRFHYFLSVLPKELHKCCHYFFAERAIIVRRAFKFLKAAVQRLPPRRPESLIIAVIIFGQ